jgi:hypothetical protein
MSQWNADIQKHKKHTSSLAKLSEIFSTFVEDFQKDPVVLQEYQRKSVLN